MSFQRMVSVSRKEVLHILRDPMTLFMTLFFPVVELMMLGYAIEMNVRNIPTVVLDQAPTANVTDSSGAEGAIVFIAGVVTDDHGATAHWSVLPGADVDGAALGAPRPLPVGRR